MHERSTPPALQYLDRIAIVVDAFEEMAGRLHVSRDPLLIRRHPAALPFLFEEGNAAGAVEECEVRIAPANAHSRELASRGG